jgi:enoyl-CoA hydratase
MALACDVRVAGESARFGFPETTLGLIPFAGGTQRLPRIVGRAKALQMVLLNEVIDAAEALRCGLVSRVVPDGSLDAEALALAERIAARGPLAVRYAKEAVLRGMEMPLDTALRFETDLTVILQTTEDRAEGVRAFLEKREPDFKGR